MSLDNYMKDAGKYPLLNHEEMLDLARKVQTGDKEARAKMINSNLRLVGNYASKFLKKMGQFGPFYSEALLTDLIQAGNVGLIKAVEKYDPETGNAFSTYAYPKIQNAVERGFIKSTNFIIKAAQVNLLRKINKIKKDFLREYNHEPNLDYIFNKVNKDTRTKYTEEFLKEFIDIFSKLDVVSLDTKIKDSVDSSTLGDFMVYKDSENIEDIVYQNQTDSIVQDTIKNLKPREQVILSLRFGAEMESDYFESIVMELKLPEENKSGLIKANNRNDGERTLNYIGKLFNLTEERIRQIEVRAKEKLKRTNLRYLFPEYV